MRCTLCLVAFGKLVRPAGGGASVLLVFTTGFLRYELCNAKHVGAFNPVECRSKWKKRSVSISVLQGMSRS